MIRLLIVGASGFGFSHVAVAVFAVFLCWYGLYRFLIQPELAASKRRAKSSKQRRVKSEAAASVFPVEPESNLTAEAVQPLESDWQIEDDAARVTCYYAGIKSLYTGAGELYTPEQHALPATDSTE